MSALSFRSTRSIIARIRSRWFSSAIPAQESSGVSLDTNAHDVPRYCYDASLLFRRMGFLQIDADELARDEPLLLRELQGLCTLCGSKEGCVRDLERESTTGERQDWREYCLNAATLNALGALHNCPRAAQYIKRPHASNRSLSEGD